MKNDTHDNDDELNTFQPLGLAAERVVNKLKQTSKLPMILMSGASENGSGLFPTTESPETLGLSVNSDLRVPALSIRGAPIYSLDAGSSPRLAVKGILLTCGLPEIGETVVGFDTVNVVNDLRWPSPMNVEPSKTMSSIRNAIYADDAVAELKSSSAPAAECGISGLPPDELSGIGRVIQEFADSFRRDEIVQTTHDSELAKDQKEQGHGNAGGARKEEEREEEQREYVDQRLRELAAFERRARGK